MKKINIVKLIIFACLGLVLISCSPDETIREVSIDPSPEMNIDNTIEATETMEESIDLQKETTYPEPVIIQSNPYPAGVSETEIITTTQQFDNDITVTASLKSQIEATDPLNFNIVGGRYQLVEFFAYWCPTCQSVAPVVHSLEVTYQDKIGFAYLDIDDPANEEFMKVLGYRYQPHFFLLDSQGTILQQWVGYVSLEEFQAYLENLE